MRTHLPLNRLSLGLTCITAAMAAIPCLSQTAESSGAVASEGAASGLGQTNIWVLIVLLLAIAAIVLALVFRKKPAALTG